MSRMRKTRAPFSLWVCSMMVLTGRAPGGSGFFFCCWASSVPPETRRKIATTPAPILMPKVRSLGECASWILQLGVQPDPGSGCGTLPDDDGSRDEIVQGPALPVGQQDEKLAQHPHISRPIDHAA